MASPNANSFALLSNLSLEEAQNSACSTRSKLVNGGATAAALAESRSGTATATEPPHACVSTCSPPGPGAKPSGGSGWEAELAPPLVPDLGQVGAAEAAAASTPSPEAADAPAASTSGDKPKRIKSPLVWIDLEMTGLDLEKDTIIEIACIVTDGELRTIIEGPDLAIHASEEVLAGMNAWCQEHHTKSGLVERVRHSTVSMADAEAQVLAFVREHAEYQAAHLAGNSVHVDRAFLSRYMPELTAHLSYRNLDVSTVSELAWRWAPRIHRRAPRKVQRHTALSDIRESLKELQYYKAALFNKKS